MGMARYLVEAHLREGRPVAELAASHGVHRSWIYKLLARYRAEGEEGLQPRSRRPRRSPSKTAESFVSEILALRERLSKDGYDAGAQTIHAHLCREHADVPSPSSIWRVLKAEGLVTPQPHKRPRSSYVRFCAELPNERWQSDITCFREVEIMGVIDDHSRLCVAARAFAHLKAADVVATFYEALRALACRNRCCPTMARSTRPLPGAGAARSSQSWQRSGSSTSTRAPITRRRAGRSSASTRR
jgi:transposase